MKTLIAFFTLISAFFLMSCSNVDQDLSPVGPETEKISVPDTPPTYPYLTTFTTIPIKHFSITPGGAIEVVVGLDEGWPDNLKHLFVMLEYVSEIYPPADRMVYLEKPRSITFQLEGFKTTGLKNVKVYGFLPAYDIKIQNPYPPQQFFNNIEVLWSANEKEIEVLILDDYNRGLGDSFVEITNDEGIYVAFIDVPTNKKIFIPNYGKPEVIGVKLYSLLH